VIEVADHDSPLGEIRVALKNEKLVGLAFLDSWDRVERHLTRWFPREDLRAVERAREIEDRLEAYMAGELEGLAGLPLETAGTDFQRRVWKAIRGVPPGQSASYTDLAVAAGAPNAVRAAGTACGANPVWLVIPCHRIVRSDGDLGNYGGGLGRKEWLLAHEGAEPRAPGMCPRPARPPRSAGGRPSTRRPAAPTRRPGAGPR